MQKSREIGARRHADAGKRLFNGAGPADALAGFEHQDTLTCACQISGASKPIVTCSDNDYIPRAGGKFLERCREAYPAQYG
jgi:hypothetical protein